MKKYFLLIMMFFFVAVNAQEVSSELITKWDNMYSESYALFNGKQNEKGLENALKLLSFTKTNFDINNEKYFYSLFFVSLGYQKVLNYKNSNEYFFELLSYIKEREEYIDLLFQAYSYIGINYVFLKENINAAEYLKKSNQLIDKFKISDALVYQNTNNYYLEYLENQIQLDILYKEAYGLHDKSNFLEAIKPFKEIIEILKIDSLVNFQSIQYINLELAICYERIDSFETSEKYFQELLTSPAKLDTGFYNKVYLDYAVLLQKIKDNGKEVSNSVVNRHQNKQTNNDFRAKELFYYYSDKSAKFLGSNTDSSLYYSTKAHEIAENIFSENNEELSSIQFYLALNYYEKNEYNKSLNFALKARDNTLICCGENEIYFYIIDHLSRIFENLNNFEKALEYSLMSLNNTKKNKEGDVGKYIYNLVNTSYILDILGNYKNALDLEIEASALTLKKYGSDHLKLSTRYNNIALLYKKLGDYEKALEYAKEAESITKNNLGESHSKYAINLNNLSMIYNDLGNYEKALKLALNAAEITKSNLGENHPEFRIRLNNISLIYKYLGIYDKALEYAIEAETITTNNFGENHSDNAVNLNNLSLIYNVLGNYEKALKYALKANDINKNNFGENHPDYAKTISTLSIIYGNLKNYNKALEYGLRDLELTKLTLGEKHPQYATSINNISVLYSKIRNNDKALEYGLKALDITKISLGENHPAYEIRLSNISAQYFALGKNSEALNYALQSLELAKKSKGENHPDYLRIIGYLAMIFIHLENFDKAFEYFTISNSKILTQIKNNYTFLTESEKENFNKLFKDGFYTFQSFSYKTYQQIAETIDEDFNIILATNGLLLNNSINIREAIKAQNDTILTTLFNNYTIATKQLDKAYEFTLEQRKTNNIDIEKLQQKAEYLERELVQRTSSFIVYPDYTLGKDDIAKVLEKNEVALQFNSFQYYNGKEWTDSTMYVAFILNNKGALQYIPLFEEATIAPLLEAFSNKEKANEVNQNLSLLYQHIWQPLLPYLKNVENIYYAPSGLLHKVPFVALKDTSHKYLGEQYQLQAVLSTRDIPKLKEQPQQQTNNLLALMGGANFDAFKQEDIDENSIDFLMNMPFGSVLRNIDRSGWLYLKGSLKEVENINALAKNSGNKTILKTGTDASEENFKKIVKEQMPGILHIATHGYYVPPPNEKPKSALQLLDDNNFKSNDNPLLRSGILLSGANQKWVHKQNTDSENDGILTALEISRLDLSKTELVVLSACETGLGDIKGSEGVYGLQRAFKMAGAKRQIVSLWQVPDKETAEMMELFYTYLFNEKLSYSEAFKKAQNTMKQNHPNEPLKWAGFVLVE